MTTGDQRETIQIKKYPNRRYYDATRSRHVTLQEVYELIQTGHDVMITDSRNGEDITNLVLLQIVLEKDHPKLDVFPSAILHLMIRSNQQVLRSSLERFFGPFMTILANSQKQFDHYVRQAMRGSMVSPLNWATTMLQAFSPHDSSSPSPDAADAFETPDDSQNVGGTLDDLRMQIAALTQRVEELSVTKRREPPPTPRATGRAGDDNRDTAAS